LNADRCRAPTLGRGIVRGRFRLGRREVVFSGDCWGACVCCGRGRARGCCGLHAAEDAGEGDEDDFAEVVEGVAAATRILDPFKGTEACGEALRVVGFIGISGHPDSVKPLDAALQIYMPLGIDSLPSVGTLPIVDSNFTRIRLLTKTNDQLNSCSVLISY
jgi:hypothetical protein